MILAIDIGGSQFGMALVDGRGKVVKQVIRRATRFGHADEVVAGMVVEGRRLIEGARVKACGIGFGGPVDFEAQRIVNSTHVPGWDDLALPAVLEDALGIPTVMDNDANVGAFGEFTYGAGQGSRNLLYYTVSTGIGGGVVIEGAIYRGSDGFAGELGHVPILVDGPDCECGNRGCLEALCSGTAIGRRGSEAVQKHPRLGKRLRKMGVVTAKGVFDAARAGDRLALRVVDETCVYLGMGMAGAMNAFAPDIMVVGGGVSKAGRVLFDPLREQVKRFLMPVHRPHVKVVPARLKGRSVLMGAVALAREFITRV
ncbi:MAG: ROK family protein [bacterium]|nr:ROK family protein [bacterium]